MTGTTSGGGYGQMLPTDVTSPFNIVSFIIRTMVNKINTMKIVKVMAVDTDKKIVTVLPLTNLTDGVGTANHHDNVYNIPYFILQSGASAFDIAPTVNDVGILVIADRDISPLKRNKVEGTPLDRANPGSFRKYAISDGIYLGGVLNDKNWTQFIKMTADHGIEITTPKDVTINTTGKTLVNATGDVDVTSSGGNINFSTPGGTINLN